MAFFRKSLLVSDAVDVVYRGFDDFFFGDDIGDKGGWCDVEGGVFYGVRLWCCFDLGEVFIV